MSKTIKKVKDIGPYIVDEKLLGEFNDHTEGVVMDNVTDRDKFKPRVKIMRSENLSLLAGSSTVAIFRIKKAAPDSIAEEKKEEINITNALANRMAQLKQGRIVQMSLT